MAAKKGPTAPRPWGEWRQASQAVSRGTGETMELPENCVLLVNNLYAVMRTTLLSDEDGKASMIWLSIRRHDREPARDWRHLQRIKNELVGAECEGVELFPAETRLVDESNQTHVWCVLDDVFRFPFGYVERSVIDADDPQLAAAGAVQRPFDKETNEMNATPRRHLSGITSDFDAEYRGDMKVIYDREPGTLIFECEIQNPPSSKGRTIYVYFQGDDLTDAMKLLRSEAIRARSKAMNE